MARDLGVASCTPTHDRALLSTWSTEPMQTRPAALTATALATVTALLLTGCGGDDEATQDAAQAQLVAGAPGVRALEGNFANVPKAPAGSAEVTGTAEMLLGQGKTKVSVLATGLDNAAQYIAHVHADKCSAKDPGGDHFKFDPNGSDVPPNEIHLDIVFQVTKEGERQNAVSAETVADKEAGEAAKSVVIHLERGAGATSDEETPPKVACADLTAV